MFFFELLGIVEFLFKRFREASDLFLVISDFLVRRILAAAKPPETLV